MAAAQYYEQVQQAYLAYYGRPADPQGLVYWATQLSNANGNWNTIISAFGNSTESQALYGSTPGAAQISAIYQQLFGHAPDAAGLNFYVNGLATGQYTLASIALNIYYGATGTDQTALNNKLVYADAFTQALQGSVQGQVNYNGNAAAANARAAVAGVTDSASEATAQANLTTTIANIGTGTVGQTSTLTTGPDNIVLTGNNNVVNAVLNAAAASTNPSTLTTLDKISGTGTGNSLNIVDLNAVGSTLPTGISVSGVQTVNLTSAAVTGSNNFSGFTGLTALNVTEAGGIAAGGVTAAATTSVNVVDSALAAANVTVLGGANVVVTAAGENAVNAAASATDAVTIGSATSAPAGTVAVTVADVYAPAAALVAATSNYANNVTVNGGTTVSVTENISTTDATGFATAYGGKVTVNGTAATTSVTVNQTAAATASTVAGHIVEGVVDGAVAINDVNYASATKGGTISSVSLNNFSGGATIDDTGLTSLTLAGTGGNVTLGNAGSLAAANQVSTLALNANAVTGTTVTDANVIKTLNVVTGGSSASNVTFDDTALTTVNVSGTQNITLTSNSTNVAAINVSGGAGVTTSIGAATAFTSTGTGNDVVTLTGALTTKSGGSISFGSGNNSLLAGGGSIGAGVTVNGGTSGNNTISATLVNAGNASGISNFQNLDVSNFGSGAGNGSLDASLMVGSTIAGVSITTNATNGTATLLDLGSAVTLSDSADGTSSSLVLTHSAGAGTLAVNFADAAKAPTTETIASLTSTGDTSISVSSAGTKGAANAITNLVETDNHLTTVTITGANAFTLGGVHTNSAATTATANVASSLTTIDGSAATGALHITAGASDVITGAFDTTYTGLTIKGGVGGDTIINHAASGVIIEGATASTLVNTLTVDGSGASINDAASAGADVIALSGFSNSATLGSGKGVGVTVAEDTFGTAGAAKLGDVATVTFGSGTATVTDALHYNVAGSSATSSNTNGDLLVLNGTLHAETVSFVAAVANASGALGAANTAVAGAQTFDQAVYLADNAAAGTVTWFQYAGNTYVEVTGAQTAGHDAHDVQLVKIAGTVDLSHASLTNGAHTITFA